jgi:putative endonuclease
MQLSTIMTNIFTKLFGKRPEITQAKVQTTWSIGQAGEQLVLEEYKKKGFHLVEQNFNYYSHGRGKKGEIDLILSKGDLLIFCEVKTRKTNSYISGIESITNQKIKLLRSTAEYYLVKNRQFSSHNIRFDVASVTSDKVDIIENAF